MAGRMPDDLHGGMCGGTTAGDGGGTRAIQFSGCVVTHGQGEETYASTPPCIT